MTKKTVKYSFGLAGAAMMFIISCNGNVAYTESYSMKNKTWRLTDVKSFDAQINDTITPNDIFFTIRTGADYPFRNIFLFVAASANDGKNFTDTLEYYLADNKGNRYGKGFGDVRELKLPYKSNVYFPQSGYKFNVRHGMKTENLKGVYDISLRIEKTQK